MAAEEPPPSLELASVFATESAPIDEPSAVPQPQSPQSGPRGSTGESKGGSKGKRYSVDNINATLELGIDWDSEPVVDDASKMTSSQCFCHTGGL